MSQAWKTSGIFASALIAVAFSVLIWKKTRKTYVKVGNISKLFFYPVKALKAVEVTEGVCTKLGLEVNGVLDRSFIIINAEGTCVHQKVAPSLVLLNLRISDKTLFILAPNGDELQVPIRDSVNPGDKILRCVVAGNTVNTVDCGDEAAAFFQKYLQKPGLRLVRYFPSMPKRIFTRINPFYSKVKKDEPVGFQNETALHLLSDASISDLNSKLVEKKVTVLNFRPNIVVTRCKAFEEDSWRYIKFLNGVELIHVLTTARCVITTNNIENGILDKKEPLVTMRKYRMHKDPECLKKTEYQPCMGVTLAVLKSGEIKVGEDIYADVGSQYEMVNKLDG